jgi:hypothetical protein
MRVCMIWLLISSSWILSGTRRILPGVKEALIEKSDEFYWNDSIQNLPDTMPTNNKYLTVLVLSDDHYQR